MVCPGLPWERRDGGGDERRSQDEFIRRAVWNLEGHRAEHVLRMPSDERRQNEGVPGADGAVFHRWWPGKVGRGRDKTRGRRAR